MNTFALIEELDQSFSLVTYYTIRFVYDDEQDELSEFEKFVTKHENDKLIYQEYQDIMSWVMEIGDEKGAQSRFFTRNENKAQALPPKKGDLLPREKSLYVKQQHNLRLYCLRINENIVFLFNGAVKTPGRITAQECRQVRLYFQMANTLAAKIDEALGDNAINVNGLKLEVEKGFELTL